MSKIFGLLASVDSQNELIKKHCYGDCGKISMGGAVIDTMLGVMLICCEDSCPYEKQRGEDPAGKSQWTGDDIYLRLLEEKPEANEQELSK